MINILNDVSGISGTNLVVPFSLDSSDLNDDALTVEIIGKIGGTYKALPKGCVFMVNTGGTEESVNTILPVDFDKIFMLRINTNTSNVDSVYIRVYNKDVSIVSPEIFVSKETLLEVATKPKVLDFRPTSVIIKDKVYCTYNGAIANLGRDKFEIAIYISNNSTSTTPVWEDVTNEYLADAPLVFKNTTKDSEKTWAVSVKYKIRKINSNSTVQISDIAVLIL